MSEMSRRAMIQVSAYSVGGVVSGLLVGFRTSGLNVSQGAIARDLNGAKTTKTVFKPNIWLRITDDDSYVFILDKTEMGQSVYTSMATIIAEELDIDPVRLKIEMALASEEYGNPALSGMQMTGGSSSVPSSFMPLRKAGATARHLIRMAAAKKWGVSLEECSTADGKVLHQKTGKSSSYGDLAVLASTLEASKDVPLKPRDQWRWLGKTQHRLDGTSKVTGRAAFGIDVMVPGLRCAVLLKAPTIHGAIESFDASEAKKIPGVEDVVPVAGGLAIVAQKYWQARQGAERVKISWKTGPLGGFDSDNYFARLKAKMAKKMSQLSKERAHTKGLAASSIVHEAVYQVPFLAHACMEPINCTAVVTKDSCEVWAPTQAPGNARFEAQKVTGLPLDVIKVHTTFIGGGFGRRLYQDYVREAVAIAKAVGKPIKLLWSREEDMRGDFYRPGMIHHLKAGFSPTGKPKVFLHYAAGPSILARALPEWVPARMPQWVPGFVQEGLAEVSKKAIEWSNKDPTATEGAKPLDYATDSHECRSEIDDPGVPVGFWRSVGHSHTAFAIESFIDEMAHLAKVDPMTYRRGLLAHETRHLRVLDLLAQKSHWGASKSPGKGQGMAIHRSFGAVVGQVVDVEMRGDRPKVNKVIVVVDCGTVINPGHVEAQIAGSVLFGLSAALYGKITIKQGQVVEGSFDQYPIVRMEEVPEIEVHLLPSDEPPCGVGEPGVPPVAPALANAIFAASERRIRTLPLISA